MDLPQDHDDDARTIERFGSDRRAAMLVVAAWVGVAEGGEPEVSFALRAADGGKPMRFDPSLDCRGLPTAADYRFISR
jgi:hypothetical protein